ncbi:MAG: hypothetical protein V9G13_07620 [Marmoricola sp.]
MASNALSIDVSDQVEQLDQLIQRRGQRRGVLQPRPSSPPACATCCAGTIERLGRQVVSNAVFHLKQAMGGGKTHLIVGTGLAAKHKDAAAQVLCADARRTSTPSVTARVVAFNGRNSTSALSVG